TLMNAREKGVPLKSVYIYARQPLNSIYVLQDSPLKSVGELKGKTLGSYSTTGGPLNESKYILKMAGLELEKDVQFVNIGFDDATAVQRGVAGVQGRYAKYKLEGPDAKWGTIPNEDARWKVMVDEALLGGSITAPVDLTTVYTRDFIAKINEFDSKQVIDQAN